MKSASVMAGSWRSAGTEQTACLGMWLAATSSTHTDCRGVGDVQGCGSCHRYFALSAEVDRTCREIGFMVISGHGVDPDLIAAVEDVSRTFFDLPLEEKMQIV